MKAIEAMRQAISQAEFGAWVGISEARVSQLMAEGVRFFIAYGRLRGGPTQHLAPGIWAATGQDGFIVRPVLMFVRDGTYESRINRERVAERADLEPYIERRIRYHVRKLAGQ